MEFTTLNQVLNAIQTVCNNHAQVKQYQFGEESEISASEQQIYPLVWANVVDSNIDEKTLKLNIDLLILDIQKPDTFNEQDTLSDTLSIAQDIYAALSNPDYQDNWTVEQSFQLSVVREALPDLVNGWRLPLTFNLEQLRDRCQIPLN